MAKIYLSSTYSDLIECREAVYNALRRMRHDVIAMEDYVATDSRPLDKCLADVEACHLYIGIFAWRYGFVPPEGNPDHKSITELEYRKAIDKNKHPLIFMLDPGASWPVKATDMFTGENKQGASITALREELGLQKTVSFFHNAEDLAAKLSQAVSLWEREREIDTSAPSREVQREPRWSSYIPLDTEQLELLLRIEEPKFFLGRKDELSRGKRALVEERLPLLVYGSPGVGKSTFISKLINTDEIKSYFGKDIFGFKLEEKSTLEDIVIYLARLLGSVHILDERLPSIKHKMLGNALYDTRPNHLIVLDNADENQHLEALLRFRDEVSPRIIVGSRTRFGLPFHEDSYIEIPDLSLQSALDLFIEHARLAGYVCLTMDQKQQATSICELLGNRPQAIVLAAGALRDSAMSIEDLREYLDYEHRELPQDYERLELLQIGGGMSRDTSILVSFSVSYQQLSPDQKKVFDTCGVFALSGAALDDISILAGLEPRVRCKISLTTLDNRSLIENIPETQRYRLHSLLHAYARRQLSKSEEGAKNEIFLENTIIGRMITQFIQYAKNNKNKPTVLDTERDNLLQASQWAYWQASQWNTESAWKAVHEFWENLDDWLDSIGDSKHWSQLTNWALKANEQLRRPAEWSNVLVSWSTYLEVAGRSDEAKEAAEKSLKLARQSQDRKSIANALARLGQMLQDDFERWAEGQALLEEAWDLSKDISDWDEAAYHAYLLGGSSDQQNDSAKALEWYRQSLEIAKRVGSLRYEAYAVTAIGNWLANQGQPDEAYRYLQRSLELKERLGNKYSRAITLASLAELKAKQDDLSAAQELLEQVILIYEEIGARASLSSTLREIGDLLVRGQKYMEAVTCYSKAVAISLELGSKNLQAITTRQLAKAYAAQNQFAEAERYYKESLSLYSSLAGNTTYQLGTLYQDMGDLCQLQERFTEAQEHYKHALSHYKRNLTISEELQDQSGVLASLRALRDVTIAQGDYAATDNYLERLVTLLEQQGERKQAVTVLHNAGWAMYERLEKQRISLEE